MKRRNIPLFDLTISAATRRLVDRTLASGWLSSGPAVRAFEQTVAERLHVAHAAAVSSATAGLVLALRAAGVRPGQEVITTPLTFIATIEAILHVGATPVLADIDPDSLTLAPDAVERRLTRKTAAILTVDLAGHPCDYVAFRKLCRRHHLHLIADSAHAIGALYRGEPIPAWVDMAVLSFYATKNLTCGEGGMVLTRSRTYADRVRMLARHGLTSSAFLRRQSGDWSYDAVDLGYKANMSDLHAAVGLGQLTEFDRHQRRREKLVARYFRNLSGFSDLVQLPSIPDHGTHSWHLFIVRLDGGSSRAMRSTLIRRMACDGIECGVHYRPVYELSYYRGLKPTVAQVPVTSRIADSLVTLPLYPAMTNAEVDVVCERLIANLRK